MIEKIAEAFLEGAIAAVAESGDGICENPYVPALAQVATAGEPTYNLIQKVNAWDEGWAWQAARLYFRCAGQQKN